MVRAKMFLRPLDSAAARVALHRSARSRGYKLSREGADPKSLWWRMGFSVWSVRCLFSKQGPLDVAPASPFIVPKGRARVTFVVKSERRKDERGKQKGGLGCGHLPPYSA